MKKNVFRKVIFKCDDLVDISPEVVKFDNIVVARNLKVTWGVIGNSLNKDKDDVYLHWIKSKHESGHYEFWNHGWSHGDHIHPEFQNRSFFYQLKHLWKTQSMAKRKLGFKFRAFGEPNVAKDKNTAYALLFTPSIKIWFFGLHKPWSNKLILDRHTNLEFPFFHPDCEKAKSEYNKLDSDKKVLVYMIHPNTWHEKEFDEFIKFIDFLESTKSVKFALPSELLA